MKVGFIGLGRMGQAMARRVLDAGHDIALYNRTPDKIADLVAAGATAAGSVADAARHGGVVITRLANDEALLAVAEGPGGLIESLPRGGVHVVMGTHGVAAVKRLICTGSVIHAGRTMLTADAKLTDEYGKLYAHGSGTFLVYPKK